MPFDDRDFPNLPKGERAMSPRSRRLVAIWLYCVAAMILVMVALGGATRVTGSGLSIMEWAPIMGTLPPWSDAEWNRLFALYQQTPQYKLVNDGFGLTGFKQIFWLEWTHRLWGRLIGAAFALPLLWFALTGRLELRLIPRLAGFLLLGGLQGAVGWFMVSSGLFPDATAVEPVRLVAHLGLALILYAMVLWTALTLLPPRPRVIEAGPVLKATAWVTLAMVASTIVAGGFVAGLRAGLTYNTFPWMDGQLVPDGYADLQPFARNLIANVPAVQFDHRLLATVTLVLASALAIATWPYRDRLGWRAAFLGVAVASQYALGVATLLLVAPAGLAVAHQVGATVLLTAALLVTHATSRASRPVPRSIRGAAHGQTLHGTPLYRSVDPSSARQSANPGSGNPGSGTPGSGTPGSGTPGSVTEDPQS